MSTPTSLLNPSTRGERNFAWLLAISIGLHVVLFTVITLAYLATHKPPDDKTLDFVEVTLADAPDEPPPGPPAPPAPDPTPPQPEPTPTPPDPMPQPDPTPEPPLEPKPDFVKPEPTPEPKPKPAPTKPVTKPTTPAKLGGVVGGLGGPNATANGVAGGGGGSGQPGAVRGTGGKGDFTATPRAPYPGIALRMKQQGTVMLRITYKGGSITDVQVVKPCPYEILNRTAQLWVQTRWKVKPGVSATAMLPVEFRIQ